MAFSLYGGNGPWFHKADRYLGFAFNINGKEHFGWARITVGRFIFNKTATISGYAYETVAGNQLSRVTKATQLTIRAVRHSRRTGRRRTSIKFLRKGKSDP